MAHVQDFWAKKKFALASLLLRAGKLMPIIREVTENFALFPFYFIWMISANSDWLSWSWKQNNDLESDLILNLFKSKLVYIWLFFFLFFFVLLLLEKFWMAGNLRSQIGCWVKMWNMISPTHSLCTRWFLKSWVTCSCQGFFMPGIDSGAAVGRFPAPPMLDPSDIIWLWEQDYNISFQNLTSQKL